MTSRDLFKCPAAQMRIASPTAATAAPTTSAPGVGWARQNTTAPKTKPRDTRSRARSGTTDSDMAGCDREAAFDRRQHFVHLNVEEAHRFEPAAPQMMTLTDRIARDG